MALTNTNTEWLAILAASGGWNWSQWISLSANTDWRRISETGAWYLWDTASRAWTLQDFKKLPKDLVSCRSQAQAG